MMTFLRHLFFDDFLLKLFSLVLGLLFWVTVSFAIQQNEGSTVSPLALNQDVHMLIRMPVQPMRSGGEARKFKIEPADVDITLQGDSRLLEDHSREIRALVEMPNSEAGDKTTNRVQVVIPAGITLVRVTPPEVLISPAPKN